MKLRGSTFAVVVASAIALSVAGAMFYRARAHDARQRRLKSVQRMLERTFASGLKRQPEVISMREFDVLSAYRRHGVSRLLYLNTQAEHRFFHDSVQSKLCFDCVQEVAPYSKEVLDAVEAGWETHSPTTVQFNSHEIDAIIPIASEGKSLGMVFLRVSDSVLSSLPEVLIAVSVKPNRRQLKVSNATRRISEEVNLSAREYRLKAESMFAR